MRPRKKFLCAPCPSPEILMTFFCSSVLKPVTFYPSKQVMTFFFFFLFFSVNFVKPPFLKIPFSSPHFFIFNFFSYFFFFSLTCISLQLSSLCFSCDYSVPLIHI